LWASRKRLKFDWRWWWSFSKEIRSFFWSALFEVFNNFLENGFTLLENPPCRYVAVETQAKSVSMSLGKDFNNVAKYYDIRHSYNVISLMKTFLIRNWNCLKLTQILTRF
jgi:hypothetical protein